MNHSPYQPQYRVGDPVRFTNEFGTVELTPVTDFLPVAEISRKHPAAQANQIPFDEAEKVVLVTGNRRIQCCPDLKTKDLLSYFVIHNSPSLCAYCSVRIVEFQCATSARQMIADINRSTSLMA